MLPSMITISYISPIKSSYNLSNHACKSLINHWAKSENLTYVPGPGVEDGSAICFRGECAKELALLVRKLE